MDEQYGGLFWTAVFVVIGLLMVGAVGYGVATVFVVIVRLLALLGVCLFNTCHWPWLTTSMGGFFGAIVAFLAYHWWDTRQMWKRRRQNHGQ